MLASAQGSERAGALEDFRSARARAAIQEVAARMTGRSADLLSYEEARRALRATSQQERGLQDIPLDAIVGSVGRYADFTRTFLPRRDDIGSRWTTVRQLAAMDQGWTPIQVYQLGTAYFVLDGNHRVSVARQMGLSTIQAYVTEVQTRVPLTPDAQPDDLICKARHADFLEQTQLDQSRPDADLIVTAPGAYRLLAEHIAVHRHFRGLKEQQEIPVADAAASWYDQVYLPVVAVIREKGIMASFPDRTETDLYIWLSKHRAELSQRLGWDVTPATAATDLVQRQGAGARGALSRATDKLMESVVPEELQPGPETGLWRQQRLVQRYADRLLAQILVPISGSEAGWRGVEQAIVLAQREGCDLHGLHVLPVDPSGKTDRTAVTGPAPATPPSNRAADVEAAFLHRCQEAGVAAQFAAVRGPVAQTIIYYARWHDLVVTSLQHPPGRGVRPRLESGFHQVIQRAPCPVMAVPGAVSAIRHPLLAYDGSPKAEEALFLATYLAQQAATPLTVVMATGGQKQSATARWERRRQHVLAYLELHEVEATLVSTAGAAAAAILDTLRARQNDLIVMGGYGANPMVEAVLGSTANEVLRHTPVSALVCQ